MKKIFSLEFNKRNICLLIFSFIINGAAITLSYCLNLPVSLDTVGTLWISMILGPTAGVLVAILTGIYVSVAFYGWKYLLYMLAPITLALVIGILAKKDRIKDILSYIGIGFIYIIVNIIVSSVVPFIMGETSNAFFDDFFYNLFIKNNFSTLEATIVASLIMKTIDVLVVFIGVGAIYTITPKKLKERE